MSSPLAVVHIVRNLEIGGLEKVVLALVEQQLATGCRVALWCLGYGGVLLSAAEEIGAETTAFDKKPGIRPGLFTTMSRRLRAFDADVVHCHNFGPLFYGAVAGRMAHVGAVVYTAHGMKTSSTRKQTWFQRLGLMDRWVTVSENARSIAIDRAGAAPDRVVAIINGVDVTRYDTRHDGAAKRRELGISEDSIVFGIVARLNHAKDHENLFRAFAQAFAHRGREVLLVVGDGELRETLETRVRELELEDRVMMLGSRHDVEELLAAMDVFVLSSYTEGLAVTLLEAHGAGLPIVATAVGGNAEVVVHGETGHVVPPRDSGRLAESLASMAADPEGARAMGARGRARVVSEFSIGRMAGRYDRLYRDVLGNA